MSETVGFIGLGVMGRPMARNLIKKGFSLVVHSRSQGPVDELVAAGAARAASPAEVARRATRIVTMLPDSPDVERVLEGPDGVFSAIQPDTILIDTSSIAPAVARRLERRAAALGARMLDAPVSGGEVGAIQATLSIMVGGDADAFAAVKPILDAMGNPDRVVRIGESGAGQTCKVCNQMVIGGTLAAVSEAFALARKAGVDPALVRAGAARRIRRQPRAGGPRRANPPVELQAGLPREPLREGPPDRERDAGGARRRRRRSRPPCTSSSWPSWRRAAATRTTRRSRRSCSSWRDWINRPPPDSADGRPSAAAGVIAPAAQLRHAARFFAVLAAVFSVGTICRDGARATGMRTGCWLGHSCLLI